MNIQTLYNKIFSLWRKKRFARFLEIMQPKPTDVLLDVGGHPAFWTSEGKQFVKQIDAINIYPIEWQPKPGFNIRTIVGDGCALTFPSKSYDIGVSNSVIEHLYTWEKQIQFAAEISRVSKSLWVQTPAYECPIEPHYIAPFIHFFPKSWQRRLMRYCTIWGLVDKPTQQQIDQCVNEIRLLTKNEMRKLFPDCEILTERLFLIFPKSHIAYRKG